MRKKLLLLSICLLLIHSLVSAQNGTLDPTFGNNGSVYLDLKLPGNILKDIANAVVITSDNKILTAGASFDGVHTDCSIMRLLSNGAFDQTFGVNGKLVFPLSENDDEVRAIAIDSDGKLLSDGSPDNSFGTDGKVLIPCTANDEMKATKLANNKIYPAGNFGNNFGIAVVDNQGQTDIQFNGILYGRQEVLKESVKHFRPI